MKAFRLSLITLTAVWLQVSFFGAWKPLGVMPDLFLVVVLAAAAALANASEILAMALGGGFLLDMASGSDFGLRTAFFCLLALLLVIMRRTGAELERPGMKLAATVAATALYDAVILLPLMKSAPLVSWSSVLSRVGTQMLLNLVIFGLLSWPLRWLFNLGVASGPMFKQEKL